MTKNINDPSSIQSQFRLVASGVCRPVSDTQIVKRSDQLSDKNVQQAKSYAQVAPLVRPLVVSPKACELKLGRERPHRLMARFSDAEKETVLRKAKTVRLSVNEYIRASTLGAGYVSSVDPVRQKLLHDLSRELGHQGNNLNQIARQLNVEHGPIQQGEGMLAEIYVSLLDAHSAVRKALAEGKVYE